MRIFHRGHFNVRLRSVENCLNLMSRLCCRAGRGKVSKGDAEFIKIDLLHAFT